MGGETKAQGYTPYMWLIQGLNPSPWHLCDHCSVVRGEMVEGPLLCSVPLFLLLRLTLTHVT